MTEIVAQARNGAVYWRGVHKSPEECVRLLDHLRRSYWQDTARPLAEQLQHAMQEAHYVH